MSRGLPGAPHCPPAKLQLYTSQLKIAGNSSCRANSPSFLSLHLSVEAASSSNCTKAALQSTLAFRCPRDRLMISSRPPKEGNGAVTGRSLRTTKVTRRTTRCGPARFGPPLLSATAIEYVQVCQLKCCMQPVVAGTFARASEDELKGRKIIKARRGPKTDTNSSNPFAGVNLTSATANSFGGVSLASPQPNVISTPQVGCCTKSCSRAQRFNNLC